MIAADPLFVSGDYGSYYLDQSSLCVDSGSTAAFEAGLDDKTTSTDNLLDAYRLDIGFHYPVKMPTFTPAPTETPEWTETPTPSVPTFTPTSGPSNTPFPTATPYPTAVCSGIYNENFENGFEGWEWDGLWHPVSNNPSSSYYTSYAEVREGEMAFWYGRNETGDYETGVANSGSLVSPVLIVGKYATLMFSSWEETEGTSSGVDKRRVLISMDYGESWIEVWSSMENPSAYRDVVIDLGGYSGLPIRLRFEFDTVDDQFNEFRGWFIDEVSIGLGPIPSISFAGLFLLIISMSIGLIFFRRK